MIRELPLFFVFVWRNVAGCWASWTMFSDNSDNRHLHWSVMIWQLTWQLVIGWFSEQSACSIYCTLNSNHRAVLSSFNACFWLLLPLHVTTAQHLNSNICTKTVFFLLQTLIRIIWDCQYRLLIIFIVVMSELEEKLLQRISVSLTFLTRYNIKTHIFRSIIHMGCLYRYFFKHIGILSITQVFYQLYTHFTYYYLYFTYLLKELFQIKNLLLCLFYFNLSHPLLFLKWCYAIIWSP